MRETQYRIVTGQRESRPAVTTKSAFRAGVIGLTLPLIGLFAVAAFLFVSMLELLWELADIAIRAIDS